MLLIILSGSFIIVISGDKAKICKHKRLYGE